MNLITADAYKLLTDSLNCYVFENGHEFCSWRYNFLCSDYKVSKSENWGSYNSNQKEGDKFASKEHYVWYKNLKEREGKSYKTLWNVVSVGL